MTPTAELCDYVLPATSFLEMANLAASFEHRFQGKSHLQYRPAVVPPLAERRSDTWIAFELAKRLGFSEKFWDGDVEAGYAYESASTGVSLEQLKAAPGGITVPVTLRYQKYAQPNGKGKLVASPLLRAGSNSTRTHFLPTVFQPCPTIRNRL